jgi:peptide/nickel transport system substrate-binding protein
MVKSIEEGRTMMRRLRTVGLALVLLAFPASAGAAKNIKDGTISVSFGADAVTMDPHTDSSAILTSVHRFVFDTLMDRERGNILPTPWAAKSYKILDGGRTIEFQMREGVKFTNGEDVDAEAVKFSLLRPRTPGFKTVQLLTFRAIDRVEVVSKWVVRVHLKYVDLGILNRMANWGHLVPPKYYSKLGQPDAAIKPIGSGPYKLARWQRGVSMTLEANPNYWHSEYPKVKTVRVLPLPENTTRVAALLKGEVDIIRNIPAQFIPQIKANPKTEVQTTRNVRIHQVGFLPMGGPTLDRRVRQAIAHAIDREAIVRDVVQGTGAVVNQPTHQWTEGYDPKFKWPYEHNLAKAKKLLAEAGYPNGFSIDMLASSERYVYAKEVPEAIAGMLSQVGIKVNLQLVAWRTFTTRFRGQKTKSNVKPMIYYYGYGNGGGDSDDTLNAQNACTGKWSGYCNPAMDKLLQLAGSASTPERRQEIFRMITEATAEDASHIIIWQTDDIYGLTKRVDFKIRGDDRIDVWLAGLKE